MPESRAAASTGPIDPIALLRIRNQLLGFKRHAAGAPMRSATAIVASTVALLPGDVLVGERSRALVHLAAILKNQEGSATLRSGLARGSVPFLAFVSGIGLLLQLRGERKAILALLRHRPDPSGERIIRMSARQKLPLVFLVLSQRLPARKLAPAWYEAGGLPRFPVVGDDPMALYRVAREALSRAREGYGPAAIDCVPNPFGRSPDPLRAIEERIRQLPARGKRRRGSLRTDPRPPRVDWVLFE